MGSPTVKLRRLLGARRYAGVWRLPLPALARASQTLRLGVATAPARPGGLGSAPAATDVGTDASTTRLYPVPSLLTD